MRGGVQEEEGPGMSIEDLQSRLASAVEANSDEKRFVRSLRLGAQPTGVSITLNAQDAVILFLGLRFVL